MTPQERAKDKRLWKAYRWTLAMYNALGAKQGWKCAICGAGVKTAPLNVDHEHFKVIAFRNTGYPALSGKWIAKTLVQGQTIIHFADTKEKAIAVVKEKALPLSVRGLLCPGRHWGCNRRLGRVDDPKWLKNALDYVLNPPAKTLDFIPNSVVE